MTVRNDESSFDCIAFKRAIQEEISTEIRGLTAAEQIEYFRHAAEEGPFAQWWRAVGAAAGRAELQRTA